MVNGMPMGYAFLMSALQFAIGPSYEVTIAGDSEAGDTRKMTQTLREQFVPNKITLLNPTEQHTPQIHQIAEFTKKQTSIDNKATAYICLNYQCMFPTTNIDKMLELLKEQLNK